MTTTPPLPFASASLQRSSAPKLSYTYAPIHSSTHRSYPISRIRMCGMSATPEKKTGPKKTRKNISSSPSSETEELVRSIVRNISDKQPLLKTLNKYVQFVRTEHCFLLFEELGKSERWLQCLEVFRWMQKQRWYIADNGVYSKLISVMGKKGQSRMAMWLFSEMRNSGCKPDTSVYNALITAHLHSRDKAKALAKAVSYFEKMKGMERCKPSIVTYNILLRAFAQAKNVDQVNALFKDLDESIVSADTFTFNGVMDAYGKLGMIREMELVLARMKSKKIKPDIITFNLLIDAYGRKQEFDKMEQVFKSLLRSKEKPTLPTFNSMITNYGKARLREKADSVYQKMIEMDYKPSFITYECLIMMYGYCDYVSRAREIFDQMVESGREKKVSTLNSMLDVYCKNSLPMEADMLFESARASRMLPVDSTTYKLLYKAYTKADMKELVEKLLMCMDKDGIIPNKKFFLNSLGALESSSPSKKLVSRKDKLPTGKPQLGGGEVVKATDVREFSVGGC
ncbi:pentatricopeptide repeat-containing protein At4g39620, chloroplastic-like isoform X2 [Salvia miltiorrhiza]|uniref:pentatricopeptide repeat-containing protein At4g39620, chloroplastic-like isoform X2 n=1 Tax=Salvia miltiorrhiza TaxID=226208 RepID=UPI0025AC4A23|nr:pentatricopeptide repeat-containing protein At4g39620, chloroplastic-like isoform X2 [Salvia miltiorrhiza]